MNIYCNETTNCCHPTKINIKAALSYFFGYKTEVFFFFQYNLKNLDPSYKMDLDLWDCLDWVKLIAKFHRTDLVIFSYFREGKTLSHSRINMNKYGTKFWEIPTNSINYPEM